MSEFETKDQMRERLYNAIESSLDDRDALIKLLGRETVLRQYRKLVDNEIAQYKEETGTFDIYSLNLIADRIVSIFTFSQRKDAEQDLDRSNQMRDSHAQEAFDHLRFTNNHRALPIWVEFAKSALPHYLRDENSWTAAAEAAGVVADKMLEETQLRFPDLDIPEKS